MTKKHRTPRSDAARRKAIVDKDITELLETAEHFERLFHECYDLLCETQSHLFKIQQHGYDGNTIARVKTENLCEDISTFQMKKFHSSTQEELDEDINSLRRKVARK